MMSSSMQIPKQQHREEERSSSPSPNDISNDSPSIDRRLPTSLVRCLFVTFTILRLILIFDLLPTQISMWSQQDRGFTAAILDPIHTIRHLREGSFLLHHDTSTDNCDGTKTLNCAYLGDEESFALFQLPPLVLAGLEPLLLLLRSNDPLFESFDWQSVMIGFVLLMADLAVAVCLYEIGISVLVHDQEDPVAKWERKLEQRMNARIRPHRAWVFGISFPPTDAHTAVDKDKIKNSRDEEIDSTTQASSENSGGSGAGNSSTSNRDTENNHDGGNEGSVTDGINKCKNECASTDLSPSSVSEQPQHQQQQQQQPQQQQQQQQPRPEPIVLISDLPYLSSLLYYCNPIIAIASCSPYMQSLQSLWYLLLLLAIREGCRRNTGGKSSSSKGSASLAMFYLAMATYVQIYPLVYFIPVALILRRRKGEKKLSAGDVVSSSSVLRSVYECFGFFLLWLSCLHLLSFMLVGDNWISVMTQTYGQTFRFYGLGPNLGMHWYIFMTMFDKFRQYFVIMLGGIPYTFVLPLSLRLHRYPVALTTAYAFLWTIFKAAPTLHDFSFVISLLVLSPRTLARMRNQSLVSFFASFVPVSLFLLDYRLWLETGSGNANYIYFQCIAYNVFLAVIFMDFVSSTVRRDKALRLTEKLVRNEASTG